MQGKYKMSELERLKEKQQGIQSIIAGLMYQKKDYTKELNELAAVNARIELIEDLKQRELYNFTENNKILAEEYGAPVVPVAFYRELFRAGYLQASKEDKKSGRPNGIAFYTTPNNKRAPIVIYDDLNKIDYAIKQNEVYCAPVGFYGRSWSKSAANTIFAMAFDLDDVNPNHVENLIHQINLEIIPRPTYIVTSGHGLHVYYMFEQPIKLNSRNKEAITEHIDDLKRDLTKYTICTPFLSGKQDAFQNYVHAYRMPGSKTKLGAPYFAQAYKSGDYVTTSYLEEYATQHFTNKARPKIEEQTSKYTKEQCKELFPNWYRAKFEQPSYNAKPRHKNIYYNYIERVKNEAKIGKRYYCILVLAATAAQCGIEYEQLERDAYELQPILNAIDKNGLEPFTREDVAQALTKYGQKAAYKMTNDKKAALTGIAYEKQRRNGRNQKEHLKIARAMQGVIDPGAKWRNKDGRPKGSGTKEQIIKEWREANPDKTKADCIRSTGTSKPTVYKYWEA